MINEKELRIGNYMIIDGKPVTVSSISEICIGIDIGISIFGKGKLEPIPLTLEILINACGFEKLSDQCVSREHLGYLEKNNDGWELDDNESGYVTDYTIKYLHQLQNLYYALTGEELPIDITKLKTENLPKPQ